MVGKVLITNCKSKMIIGTDSIIPQMLRIHSKGGDSIVALARMMPNVTFVSQHFI